MGLAEGMIRVARIQKAELIPAEPQEPINLNVARRLRDYLELSSERRSSESWKPNAPNPEVGGWSIWADSGSTRRSVRSIIVVTSGFRSERQPSGISV